MEKQPVTEKEKRPYKRPRIEKVKIARNLALRMATCACAAPKPFSDNCW